MNKKTDNLKIDINTINPYTNNILWSLLYFKDLKKQGKTIYLNKQGKKQNIQLKIDNLKRRMKKTRLAKNLLKQHNRHLKEWLPHKVKVDMAKILSNPKTYE